LILILKLFPKDLNTNLGRIRFPARSEQPNSPRSRPTKPHPLPLLATTRRQHGPTRRSTTHLHPQLFSARLGSAPHLVAHAAAARTGWGGLPARPARTPREQCTRAHPNRPGPRQELPQLPLLCAPLQPILSGGRRCHLGHLDGQSRGNMGLSLRCSRHQASKARRGRNPGAQATNPFGVFDSLIPCLRAERGGHRRRAAPEEQSTDREPVAGRGEGRHRGHLPHRRDPLPQAGNAYTVAPP
jgi:hypothetical protein